MNDITARLEAIFGPERIIELILTRWLPDLIVAMLTFAIFYVGWRALSAGAQVVLRRSSLDETAVGFIQTVLRYSILTVGLVTALGQMGINTASILTSLGVAGLSIGFAAKDALSNVISGLFIFWDRPFVIGDLVEIDGQYGRVTEITMRSTRVVTVDGRMLAIPNSTVVNGVATSYTNFPHLRLDVAVTVGTGEDLGRVRALLLGIVEGDERYMGDPPPKVVVTALNDYNVALELRAWIHDERSHIPLRFELRERVFEVLRDAQVDMPTEQLAVELKRAS